MGTGDSRDLGTAGQGSRGAKISFPAGWAARNAPPRGNLRQFKSWRTCETTPDQESRSNAGVRMSKFLRKPEAILWVVSISQAAAMLAFNVAAAGRRLVKHLPLFFDLAGRKVVVVGDGPAADRRAETARSAGADVVRVTPGPRRPPISGARPRPSSRRATLDSDTAAPAPRQGGRRAGERGRPAGALRLHPAGHRRPRRRRGRDLDRRRLAHPGELSCAAASKRPCPNGSARWRSSPRPSAPRRMP